MSRFTPPWAVAVALAFSTGALGGLIGTLRVVLSHESIGYVPSQPGTVLYFIETFSSPAYIFLTGLGLGAYGLTILLLRPGSGSTPGRTTASLLLLGLVVLAVALLGAGYIYLALSPGQDPEFLPRFIRFAILAAFFGYPAAILLLGAATLHSGRRPDGYLMLALGGVESSQLALSLLTFEQVNPARDWLVALTGFSPGFPGLLQTAAWLTLAALLLRATALGSECLQAELLRHRKEMNLLRTRRLYTIALARNEPELIAGLAAPEMTYRDQPDRGLEHLRRSFELLWSTFPDLQVKVTEQCVRGDTVFTTCRLRGTDRGGFEFYPPTGRRASFHLHLTDRLQAGKITHHDRKTDRQELLDQLGLSGPE